MSDSNAEELGWVTPSDEEQSQDFYVDSPKGVIRQDTSTVSGSVGAERGIEPPTQKIEDFRDIARTDPHVKEGISTLLDWTMGDGFNISPRNLDSTLESGLAGEAADVANSGNVGGGDALPGSGSNVETLRILLQTSNFWSVANNWVRRAIVDGHAFMELVVEGGEFKPKVLPTTRVRREVDKHGDIKKYVLEAESSADENLQDYKPNQIAELFFIKHPEDDFGRSLIEPAEEPANILRDMEIDYARFVATKAYPPVLWKLGTDERSWTDEQISSWMESVQNISPDTMLAAPHDVDYDIVGTTSTSSSAGAMRLEETFEHFENRVVTALGIPRILMNMESSGQGEATATMPSFKRRISRLQQRIKSTVEHQIFRSLLKESISDEDNTPVILPEFQFGEHSSAEKRLELDKLLNLFNNGLLTPEAFAERAGLDPNEIPGFWDDFEHIKALMRLSGTGDNIQNPEGGSPTDTGGGAESSGGEVTSRQNPEVDPEDGRNRRSITEEENA